MVQVSCVCCGRKALPNRMIRRRLNGRDTYCCSLKCEVKWEKSNLMGVCG